MSRLLVLVLLLPTAVLAQRATDADHVSVDSAGPGRRVYYEHRLYRNPLPGMVEMHRAFRRPAAGVPASGAPAAGDPAAQGEGSPELVPLLQGVPVGAYRLMRADVDFRALTRAERRAYHRAHPINPLTSYRFDFKIQPEFIANFGNFQRPVESRTSVLLQSQLYLWRGLVVHYGLLFPIVNHLDGRPDNIRPAPFYANQFLALGGPHFLSVSAGLFPSDAWGGNVQYQRMDLDGRWSWGLEAGLTGFYYYPRGGIYYTRPDELLLLANLAYRHPAHDLTVKLTAGQYPAGDRGARMDMIRQFTNVEVALYATKTGNGATVGFNLAVPIPPGKIVQGRYLRLRTTEEFRWEYTYTRGYRIGERYRLGYQLDERLRQYHRGYLSNQWRRAMGTQ